MARSNRVAEVVHDVPAVRRLDRPGLQRSGRGVGSRTIGIACGRMHLGELFGGRGRLAIGALVAVALVAAGVAVLARSGEDADAAEALRAAQELVAATEAFRFAPSMSMPTCFDRPARGWI